MNIYSVRVYSWENPRFCSAQEELNKGDKVVIKEGSFNELGVVVSGKIDDCDGNVTPIVRKATDADKEAFIKNSQKKKELLATCKSEVNRMKLDMKLVDAHVSLDGSNAIITFTADERVDFRDLVKNLSKIFHRSVRMHQIGSRDEARKIGGCGVCGRGLCCLRFSGNLPSITIDMARVQQVAHRGAERISGICGRLMCCLSYEAAQYQEMLKGMPALYASVKTKQGKGEVIEVNALTLDIKVRLQDGDIISVKKEDLK
jgi:cell fate regulator YaaT (PSP1 superfamily)